MSETQKLLVATGNPGKMREVSHILEGLPFRVLSLQDLGVSMTVEETGVTFAENAILKAKVYCTSAGMLTMADDSGLVVDALNGRPGVLSARYGGEELSDPERVELLLKEMRRRTVGETDGSISLCHCPRLARRTGRNRGRCGRGRNPVRIRGL